LYSWLTPEQQELLFRQSWLRRPWSSFTAPQQAVISEYLQEREDRESKAFAELPPEDRLVMRRIDARPEVARSGITFILVRRTGFTSASLHLGVAFHLTVAFPEAFRGFLLPAHGNPYTREAIPPDAPLPPADQSLAAM